MISRALQAAALALALCVPAAVQAQDLKINSTVAPSGGSTAQAGAQFTVQYVVANVGSVHTGTFYVRYYFCQTTTTVLASCAYLGANAIGGMLGGTTQSMTSNNLIVPTSAEYGTGQVRFIVDYYNYINETNETNNISHDAISITKRPDLSSNYHSFPYTGSITTVGSTFTGRYRVNNASNSSKVTTNFKVAFAYCPGKSSTGCIALGDHTVSTDINSGSSSGYVTTPQLTIPQGAQNGTRYIRVTVDSGSAVIETNESNNVYYSSISITQVESNLKITSFIAPNTGIPDKAYDQITVKNTIKNDSIHGFTTDIRVQYFYCHTQSTTSCTSITTMNISQNFAAGQSMTFTSPTLTLPSTLRYGTGYVRIFVDSLNKIPEGKAGEADNDAYAKITATVRPDLTPSYVSVPYTGSTATTGSQFTVRYRIRNASYSTQCFEQFKVTFHFCPTSSTATASCIKLTEATYNGVTSPISAGASSGYQTSPTLTMPSTARNGTRYIRVTVDSSNNVLESNETNNVYNAGVSVTLVKSDLKIASVTVPASGSTKGAYSSFTVNYSLTNASVNGFDTNFHVRFYYCLATATPLTSCTYISSTYIQDNFNANQTRSFTSSTISLPNSVVYGTGYIRLVADYSDTIPETNENNNVYDGKITVGTAPDLTPTYVSAPYTGGTDGPGAKFTVRYRVRNQNYTSLVTTDFLVYFFYCDTNSSTGCTSLGTQKVTTDLNAGASTSYLVSPTLTLPSAVKIGTRYLRVFVDGANAVQESVETNNNYYDPITVVKQQVDLLVAKTSVPASGDTKAAGSQFTAKVSIRAIGAAVTKGFTINYYYCPAKSTSGCTLLGSGSVTQQFLPGDTKEFTSPTLTIPKTAQYGTSYLRILIDAGNAVTESDEANNEVYPPITVTSAPDLSVLGSQVPLSGNLNGPGSTFTAQYILQNKDKTSSTGKAFTVGFYYCTTQSSTSCTPLGSMTMQKMNSGAINTLTSPTLTLPSGVTPKAGFIRVFLDTKNDIAEALESNNERYDPVSPSAGLPDLTISLLKTTVSSQTVDFMLVICNQGAITKTSIGVELYYNLGGSGPGCTTGADKSWIISGGLGTSSCTTRTHTRTNVKAGGYLAWARADADCAIKEKNETNNNKSAAYIIAAIPDMMVPDMMVPDMTVPDMMVPDLMLPDLGPDIGPDSGPDVGLDAGPGDGFGDGYGDGYGDGFGDGFGDGTGDGFGDGLGDGTGDGLGDGTGDGKPDGSGSDSKPGMDGKSSEAGTGPDGSTPTAPPSEDGCNCAMDSEQGAGQGLWLLLGIGLLVLARRRRRCEGGR